MSQPNAIEFFFDVVSPYSYLASTQVDAVAARSGVPFAWRPMFLGGLMKAVGNLPPATLAPRGRYMGADLKRWAKRYGIDYRFPSAFPIKTITAQRMIIASEKGERLAKAFFRAYWADNRDISDPDTLRAVADAAGQDGAALLEGASRPEVKDTLKANTAEAAERGAFGAPTFFHGDAMYFGNDRLGLLEDALTASE